MHPPHSPFYLNAESRKKALPLKIFLVWQVKKHFPLMFLDNRDFFCYQLHFNTASAWGINEYERPKINLDQISFPESVSIDGCSILAKI